MIILQFINSFYHWWILESVLVFCSCDNFVKIYFVQVPQYPCERYLWVASRTCELLVCTIGLLCSMREKCFPTTQLLPVRWVPKICECQILIFAHLVIRKLHFIEALIYMSPITNSIEHLTSVLWPFMFNLVQNAYLFCPFF